MKFLLKAFVMMLGFVALALAEGCSSVGSMVVEGEMNRRNEADLKSGRSSPQEYQQRRDEIDHNLK